VFADSPLVSVSDDQRKPLPRVNWIATVHHALPADLLRPPASPAGDYLAFLGRISPEKQPDVAIEIAARVGMSLKIAAKIDKADQAYWDETIAPLVRAHRNVEFIGEIDEAAKSEFLGNAAALLFPIDWPEPFGLVMIEAFACATPVIAFRSGSVMEVVEDGVSGFIVDTVEQAVARVARIGELSRPAVRRCFERRFTVDRMARDYLDIYRTLTRGVAAPPRSMRRPA